MPLAGHLRGQAGRIGRLFAGPPLVEEPHLAALDLELEGARLLTNFGPAVGVAGSRDGMAVRVRGDWAWSGSGEVAVTVESDAGAMFDAVEAALALGKGWREASRRFQKQAAGAGMLSILNFLKTVGIVALPGAMTGMILAGASPLEAVQLQVIVMYMLIGAVAFSGLTATFLCYRQFFTRAHQLIISDR